MKKLILIIIGLFFISAVSFTYAEIITLKSGKTVEGEVIERTDGYVKIDFYGVPVTYLLSEVESIGGEIVLLPVEETANGAMVEVKAETKPEANSANKDIIDNIKKTTKNVARVKTNQTEDVQMAGFLHSLTEKVSDVDFEQKVMSVSSIVKEYDFEIKDLSKNMLEQKIIQAERDGESKEKIQQMRDMSQKMSEGMDQMMSNFSKMMKDRKTELFILDKYMYLKSKDRWLKLELPFFDLFWQVISGSRTGKIDKEEFEKMLKDHPQTPTVAFEPLLASLDNKNLEEIYNNSNITEDAFMGKPCYVVCIESKEYAEAIKDTMMSFAKSTGKIPTEISVDSFTYIEFISKESYLRLGSQANMAMVFKATEKMPDSLKASFKIDTVYSYPEGKIQIPPELGDAVAVKDENELQQMMMQDMGDMFGDLFKGMPVCPLKQENTQN
jgi:hypothetical protein